MPAYKKWFYSTIYGIYEIMYRTLKVQNGWYKKCEVLFVSRISYLCSNAFKAKFMLI